MRRCTAPPSRRLARRSIRRSAMRRFGVLVSMIAVMLLGVLALHAQPVAVAQEASPAAGGMMEPEGVTFEPIALSSGLTLPSPADMIAARFRIQPGATLPL